LCRVPITGGPSEGKTIRFSIWETRVKDYAEFAEDAKRELRNPGFEQRDDHPAVYISWDEAVAFCEWLTKEERRRRKIGPKDVYRLPTDHEWSCALGIGKEEDPGATPSSKNQKVKGYPWGDGYPPPKGSGNFFGEETKRNPIPGLTPLSGYNDGFDRTSPVGSFTPNSDGLYDLSGNAFEWCQDLIDPTQTGRHVARGGSCVYTSEFYLRSSYRDNAATPNVTAGFRVVLEVAPAN